jgi:hypothetical protein
VSGQSCFVKIERGHVGIEGQAKRCQKIRNVGFTVTEGCYGSG